MTENRFYYILNVNNKEIQLSMLISFLIIKKILINRHHFHLINFVLRLFKNKKKPYLEKLSITLFVLLPCFLEYRLLGYLLVNFYNNII